MRQWLLQLWMLGILWIVRVRAHFPTIYPTLPAKQPLDLDDIDLARAIYGRLNAESHARIRFEAPDGYQLRTSVLIPQTWYQAGFVPEVRLFGPGLPEAGYQLPAGDYGERHGRTAYQRTHRATVTLQGGWYQLQLTAPCAGAYCLCTGSRETPRQVDPELLQAVETILTKKD